jgi:hypothetical protein
LAFSLTACGADDEKAEQTREDTGATYGFDHYKNVLITTVAAESIQITDRNDGTFELSLTGASDFIAFHGVPPGEDGVSPDSVQRLSHSKNFLETLEHANSLHSMQHPDGLDTDNDGVADASYHHHNLNAAFIYFDDNGFPITIIFSIEDFVEATETTATWIVRPHADSTMVPGTFNDVSIVIDGGWFAVAWFCGILAAEIILEVVGCGLAIAAEEVGTAGAATVVVAAEVVACFSGILATFAGSGPDCLCAVQDYADIDLDTGSVCED